MNMRKDFEIRYRIRQVICAILGVCIAALLTGILVERRMEWVEAKMSRTQETLAKEVLRFHVLANSDSEEDQAVKLKVRDKVLAYMEENMTPELKEEPDAGKTRAWIEAHLDEITDTAGQVLKEEGFSYGCASELELAYFPDKQYGDIFFPQGEYEALRVRLGEARGHNWWCVLYPSLCFTDTTCTVVSDEGRKGLKEVLTAEEYEMVTATSDFKIKWFFFGDNGGNS